MNNLLSYCGFIGVRISASEKDLPIPFLKKNLNHSEENNKSDMKGDKSQEGKFFPFSCPSKTSLVLLKYSTMDSLKKGKGFWDLLLP